MRKILVLQHVAHEPLGTLNPLLKKAGFRIRYYNFGRTPEATPKLDGYSGLVVLGGPVGVYQCNLYQHLNVEMKVIEEAFKKNIPILGICLGSQLIAQVLGSPVRKHHTSEMGWCKISLTDAGQKNPLFEGYQKSENIFQLHGDTYDPPKSATLLASSEVCESQAFVYGDRVYGLQFHLEVDKKMIHRWLQVPANKEDLSAARISEEQVVADTQKYIERSLQLSHQTFSKFIDIFEFKKSLVLDSGHGKPKK